MSLIHRAGVLQMAVKSRTAVAALVNGQRAYASDPPTKDEYPTNIDPVEWAVGQERKILLARLAGDDVSLSVLRNVTEILAALRSESLPPWSGHEGRAEFDSVYVR
jgi:hypothetical protein